MAASRWRCPGSASLTLALSLTLCLVAQQAAPSRAFERRALGAQHRSLQTSSPRFNSVTESALLEFVAVLGNNTRGQPGFWGASWVSGSSCGSWSFTTCSGTGDLLSLSLQGQSLEGVIPTSFYRITTLTRLDLRSNRLYGTVDRRLAVYNPNLVYLDLSNNFFTGRFPDIWGSTSIYADNTNLPGSSTYNVYRLYYTFGSVGGTPIYVDISNNWFTGFQTLYISNSPNLGTDTTAGFTGPRAYPCIGINLQGMTGNTCLTKTSSYVDLYTEGACSVATRLSSRRPVNYTAPAFRTPTDCYRFCGTRSGTGTCNYRAGAVCKPTFASLTDNTVLSAQCILPPAAPASPPPPAVTATLRSADVAALKNISSALGNPGSLAGLRNAATSTRCSTLAPLVYCSSNGSVIALNLAGLALQATIPAGIAALKSLQSLSLSRNSFYGRWNFVTATDLPNLVSLDLSSNFLSGPVPTGFALQPTLVNLTSNYFSGNATVQTLDSVAYCPLPGASFTALNCLANYANSPCPGEAQRAAADCFNFCGIVLLPQKSGITSVGPCGDGVAGVCMPGATAGTGTCTLGTVPSPPPMVTPPKFVFEGPLMFFVSTYQQKYGSPKAIFSTWVQGAPCNTWAGLTCDFGGNLIAVDLKGTKLTGPFPGPKLFEDLFWTYSDGSSAKASTVRYFDVSNNALYGFLDPLLSSISQMNYLDFSQNGFTGPLPTFQLQNFQYLNVSNNYLAGVPYVVGPDLTTPVCAGTNFFGSLDGNCFDTSLTGCSPAPVNRGGTACTTGYCKGASATAKFPGSCASKTPVCKPKAGTFPPSGWACSK